MGGVKCSLGEYTEFKSDAMANRQPGEIAANV